MRIACIYWQMVGQIGGIATRLNRLRQCANNQGDQFDILLSGPRKSKQPGLFKERKWMQNKDTCIWTCGEAPHHPANVKQTVAWLENNYDAILMGYICPNKTKAYPDPLFLEIYNCKLPKVAYISDGYWDVYKDWAELCLPHLNAVVSPQEAYLQPAKKYNVRTKMIPFPFVAQKGKLQKKSEYPLLVWPNQWKGIKGIKQFLSQVPKLPEDIRVEMYSCAVDYYQLRTKPLYLEAIATDHFKGFNGNGRAEYFGNVDIPRILQAVQAAWWTCNLQGISTRKETYKQGSYNNAEVEALWYGACPILHSSVENTALPQEVILTVDSEEEIPTTIDISREFAIEESRIKRAKEFVKDVHWGSKIYKQLKELF